jgi:hypothetical protein
VNIYRLYLEYVKFDINYNTKGLIFNSYSEKQKDATVYLNFIIPNFKLSSTCFGRRRQNQRLFFAVLGS